MPSAEGIRDPIKSERRLKADGLQPPLAVWSLKSGDRISFLFRLRPTEEVGLAEARQGDRPAGADGLVKHPKSLPACCPHVLTDGALMRQRPGLRNTTTETTVNRRDILLQICAGVADSCTRQEAKLCEHFYPTVSPY